MHSMRMKLGSAATAALLLQACASSTIINSRPQGAKLYVDGEFKGNTPYAYSDQKIVGSTSQIRLVKEGYQDTTVSMSRNEEFSVGACIGGVLVLVPFLWIMNYKGDHTYELTPLEPRSAAELPPVPFRLAENEP
jgi:hypothetical protein